MFDNLLVLLDGSVDLSDSTHTPPISTTVDEATGAKVIDLKETGATGLVAVLICVDDVVQDADTLTAFIEVSDSEDMTAETNDVHEMGKFDIAAEDKGVLLGSETPCVCMVRFATKKRYVRLNATVGTSPDDFLTVKCYLVPYAFGVL